MKLTADQRSEVYDFVVLGKELPDFLYGYVQRRYAPIPVGFLNGDEGTPEEYLGEALVNDLSTLFKEELAYEKDWRSS